MRCLKYELFCCRKDLNARGGYFGIKSRLYKSDFLKAPARLIVSDPLILRLLISNSGEGLISSSGATQLLVASEPVGCFALKARMRENKLFIGKFSDLRSIMNTNLLIKVTFSKHWYVWMLSSRCKQLLSSSNVVVFNT